MDSSIFIAFLIPSVYFCVSCGNLLCHRRHRKTEQGPRTFRLPVYSLLLHKSFESNFCFQLQFFVEIARPAQQPSRWPKSLFDPAIDGKGIGMFDDESVFKTHIRFYMVLYFSACLRKNINGLPISSCVFIIQQLNIAISK